MSTLVGREAELRVGDAFVRAITAGPAVLVIDGEAGIGKTRLWSELAQRAQADGLTVLRSQPTAAETSLTLSALADLLEAVPGTIFDSLPDVQRRAIDAALLHVEPAGDGLQQRLLGTATRSILRELSVERPLIIAIDDLQWLDGASAATLSFALRRLVDAPVGVLAARRLDVPGPLDMGALPDTYARHEVRLGPLSLAALHHLLKDRLGRPLPRSTLVRVHQASGGHPLFAIEIARPLHELAEIRPDQPLPIPPTVRELVGQRAGGLPASTRAVLLAAASLGEPTVAAIASALERDIASDVDVAQREDIASVEAGRINFTHPLFANAIYVDASDDERRAMHARLARTAEHVEERARHGALATTEADGQVAAELDEAAHAAAARAAPLAAADLMRLALRMTPPAELDAIDDRKLALGGFLKLGGDATEAERVLLEATTTASTRRNGARAKIALAALLYDVDPGPRPARLASEALAEAAGDAELVVYAHAMLAAVEYGDRQRGDDHADVAMQLLGELTDPSPTVELLTLFVYVGTEVHRGNQLPMDVVERALELERTAARVSAVGERLSASLGYWLLSFDDIEGARHQMETTYAAALDEGDEGSVPYALSHLPLLEFAAGNWQRAEEVARRHLAVSTELGQDSQRHGAMFSLATVLTHQGREAEARPLIEELLREGEAADSLWDVTNGLAALGGLELAMGRPAAAVAHLLAAEQGRDQLGEDMTRRHEADLVEALIATGRTEQAAEIVAKVERRARRYPRASRLAVAARGRALLSAATGRLDDAVAALEEAMHEHAQAPLPFDRARTELVLGRVRRRRRERTLAKAAFESSLATFEQLGAQPWAARTGAELERVGLRRGSSAELTAAERRVAELAASGMTNRQVADALFVSPKTVEVTLARAYHKLGVHSRAELGALAAQWAQRATDVGNPQMRKRSATA